MNVLILSDYYPPDKTGGVGEIARRLRDAYEALGHRVFVLTTGEKRPEEARSGIRRSSRSLLTGVLANNLHALRLLRREAISLVHLHQSSTTLFLLAKPFLRPFPVVLDSLQVSYLSEAREIRTLVVGGRRFRPRTREYLERFLFSPGHLLLDFIGYALSDQVTVVSSENRIELLDTFGRLLPKAVTVIPNGVSNSGSGEPGPFRDPALETRLEGNVVVSYVGVFRTRKRVQNLLLALATVARKQPRTMLLLVGGGRGYEEGLSALVGELGLGDHVIFVGAVPPERVRYYLGLSDIFCLLSSYEGMPMALLEAMEQGKAVVAADRYGMREVLAGRAAGVLVPVDDVPATARALAELIASPERREALGRAARELVHDHYRWDSIARRYLALAAER